MLTRDFNVERVEKLRPRIQSIVDGLIDELLEAGPPADLVSRFALPVPSLVICELLGVPYADHDFFQRCARVMVNTTTPEAESIAAMDELRSYLKVLISAKEQGIEDDVLSRPASSRPCGSARGGRSLWLHSPGFIMVRCEH